MFRPFPSKELCKILEGAKKVAVLDRDNSLGAGGIVAQELKAALFNSPRKPKVFEFIAGLGGKDITPETIQEILEYTIRNPNSNGLPMWIGVQK
jgi:pyruvate/2-oxoacid:ferredoxin oxidoreductase alpha subunit